MIPNFEIFNRTLSAYAVMAALGFLVTLLVMYKGARKVRLDEFHVMFMLLFAGIGIVVGGHILYGLTNIEYIINLFSNLDKVESFSDFMDHIYNIFGGAVFYGGMLGAVWVGLIYAKVKKIDKREYVNYLVLAIPLFHIFGRIGCFMSGCCFGVEWEHGVTFHHSMIEIANGVPRFPVQLVEAFCNVVIFFVLWYIFTKTKYKYKTFDLYLITYGVVRFTLEFLRGDEYRGIWFALSTSQWISLILIIYAVVKLTVDHFKDKKLKEA